MNLLKLGAGTPLLDKISQSPFHGYKTTKKDNPTPIHIEWGPFYKRSGVAYLDCLHPPCLWFQDLGTWRERGRLTICLLCLERERRGKCTFDIGVSRKLNTFICSDYQKIGRGRRKDNHGSSFWLHLLLDIWQHFIKFLSPFILKPYDFHLSSLLYLFLVHSTLLFHILENFNCIQEKNLSSIHRWVG